MSEDIVWQAWVKAHHARGCAYRNTTEWERCRYRVAHIQTAKDIAADLAAQGWHLCRDAEPEAESIPMFGAS